jgi:hypothetical protein
LESYPYKVVALKNSDKEFVNMQHKMPIVFGDKMIELFVDKNGRIYEVIPDGWSVTEKGRLLFSGPYEVWNGPAEIDNKITFFNPYYLGSTKYLPADWEYLGGLYD